MAIESPFIPKYGAGVTVTPTTSSASSTIGLSNKTLMLTNLSTTVVSYVRLSLGASTATTADLPIPPSAQVKIGKDQDFDTVSYITASGSGSLHILPGEGW